MGLFVTHFLLYCVSSLPLVPQNELVSGVGDRGFPGSSSDLKTILLCNLLCQSSGCLVIVIVLWPFPPDPYSFLHSPVFEHLL